MVLRLSLIFSGVLLLHGSCSRDSPKIAIVGGGIGGTATAYFLREYLSDVSIDVYESNKIGGRLATVTINNEDYETGGSILHPKNKYMLDFLKVTGLKKRKNVFSKFGLYDGTEFVFKESDWQLISLSKLVWRYGYGAIKLQRYISSMLKSFQRIYTLQRYNQCFTSVGEMLKTMNPTFFEDLQVSTKKGFMQEGFSEKVVDELVMATLTANYGQTTDVHKFVGLVSVAGADGELWAVEGGNKAIPQKLLEISKARLINAQVTKVTYKDPEGGYLLEFKDKSSSNISRNVSYYDMVVLATPLTDDVSSIKFDIPTDVTFPGKYHRTVCTIVHGTVNHTYFGIENEAEMVDEILTVNLDNFYNSVGRINAVNVKGDKGEKSNIWKLFSQVVIRGDDLKKLFSDIQSVDVVDWLAYPQYSSKFRDDKFVLHENLYHINAIEWAASAMEMSAIGAKNVALLIFKTWYGIEYQNPNERFIDEF